MPEESTRELLARLAAAKRRLAAAATPDVKAAATAEAEAILAELQRRADAAFAAYAGRFTAGGRRR